MNRSRLAIPFPQIVLGLLFLLTVTITAYGQELGVTNTARYVGSGRYDWTVFLVGDEYLLNSILYAEYVLHPSFPNPVRRAYERNSRFSLHSNGWGEFNILVKVVFRDGRVIYLQHWLRLR